eukprot:TRINITY_DN51150_c0_g1_i1.p1 TRINITY_DN51150_c0_g1~~TRINITY_DN51150_c0_g1_i1.p1  ORF type:complete len:1559 (+),score=233.10 TRINITY_DN51150_c0_g1_i1:143-4819(+)
MPTLQVPGQMRRCHAFRSGWLLHVLLVCCFLAVAAQEGDGPAPGVPGPGGFGSGPPDLQKMGVQYFCNFNSFGPSMPGQLIVGLTAPMTRPDNLDGFEAAKLFPEDLITVFNETLERVNILFALRKPAATLSIFFCAFDDEGDEAKAVELYTKMATTSKFRILLGPATASYHASVAKVADMYNQALILWSLPAGVLSMPMFTGQSVLGADFDPAAGIQKQQRDLQQEVDLLKTDDSARKRALSPRTAGRGRRLGGITDAAWEHGASRSVFSVAAAPGTYPRGALDRMYAAGARSLAGMASVDGGADSIQACNDSVTYAASIGYDVFSSGWEPYPNYSLAVYPVGAMTMMNDLEGIPGGPQTVILVCADVGTVRSAVQAFKSFGFSPPALITNFPHGQELIDELMGWRSHYLMEPVPWSLTSMTLAAQSSQVDMPPFTTLGLFLTELGAGVERITAVPFQLATAAQVIYAALSNTTGLKAPGAMQRRLETLEVSTFTGPVSFVDGRRKSAWTDVIQYRPWRPSAGAETSHGLDYHQKRYFGAAWSYVSGNMTEIKAFTPLTMMQLDGKPNYLYMENYYEEMRYPMPGFADKELDVYLCPVGCIVDTMTCEPCTPGRYRDPKHLSCDRIPLSSDSYGDGHGFAAARHCLDGAACNQSDPAQPPVSSSGYYRVSRNITLEEDRELATAKCNMQIASYIIPHPTFLECKPRHICLGDNQCLGYNEGYRCAECKRGTSFYTPYYGRRECRECASETQTQVLLGVMLCLFVGLLLLLSNAAAKQAADAANITATVLLVTIQHFQTLSLTVWLTHMDEYQATAAERIPLLPGDILLAPLHVVQFDCLFPDASRAAQIEIDFAVTLGFSLLGYLVIWLSYLQRRLRRWIKQKSIQLVGLKDRLKGKRGNKANFRYQSCCEGLERDGVARRCTRMALCWALLTTPMVMRACLTLSCKSASGLRYIKSAPGTSCDDPAVKLWRQLASALLLVLVIGVPLGLLRLLVRIHTTLDLMRTRECFGLLYGSYRHPAFWFEFVWVCRLSLLVLVSMTESPPMFPLIILLSFRFVYYIMNPMRYYDRGALLSVHSISFCGLALNALLAMTFDTGFFNETGAFAVNLTNSAVNIVFVYMVLVSLVYRNVILPLAVNENCGVPLGRLGKFILALGKQRFGLNAVEVTTGKHTSTINMTELSEPERAFLLQAMTETMAACFDSGDMFSISLVIEAVLEALERAGQGHVAHLCDHEQHVLALPRKAHCWKCCGCRKRHAKTESEKGRRKSVDKARKRVLVDEVYEELVDINKDVLDHHPELYRRMFQKASAGASQGDRGVAKTNASKARTEGEEQDAGFKKSRMRIEDGITLGKGHGAKKIWSSEAQEEDESPKGRSGRHDDGRWPGSDPGRDDDPVLKFNQEELEESRTRLQQLQTLIWEAESELAATRQLMRADPREEAMQAALPWQTAFSVPELPEQRSEALERTAEKPQLSLPPAFALADAPEDLGSAPAPVAVASPSSELSIAKNSPRPQQLAAEPPRIQLEIPPMAPPSEPPPGGEANEVRSSSPVLRRRVM